MCQAVDCVRSGPALAPESTPGPTVRIARKQRLLRCALRRWEWGSRRMSDNKTRGDDAAAHDFDNGRSKPSTSEVRAALERILASRCFQQAGRASDFLRYVVEQTLAGGGQRLKGYTIGVEVFGRPADFDAQSDALVRVEAGRLRRRLVEYYAGEGVADAVRIELPRGTYAAEYRFACTDEHASAPTPAPLAEAAQVSFPWRRARVRTRRVARRRGRCHRVAAVGAASDAPCARVGRGAAANGVAEHSRGPIREPERRRHARCVRGQHDGGDHAAAR